MLMEPLLDSEMGGLESSGPIAYSISCKTKILAFFGGRGGEENKFQKFHLFKKVFKFSDYCLTFEKF